jgi:CIC family chloride channel protein
MESIKLLSLENPELTLKNTFFESLSSPWMFLIFCGAIIFFKAIATGLTLGSGGNGGNFAPSLFVGSYTGFAFAYGLNLTGWIPNLPVTNFTVAGMAGVLSGLFHAPLTAMFLIAELTGGYELLIPLMIVSSISFALSKYYTPHSMDMLRLASDAPISGTSEKDKQILGSMSRHEVMETMVVVLSPRDTLQTLLDTIQESPQAIFPVVRSDGKLLGMLYLDDLPDYLQLMRSAPHTSLNELMSPIQITVGPDDPLESVMALMDSYNLNYIPIVFHEQVTGYYSRNRILESYRKNLVDSFVE